MRKTYRHVLQIQPTFASSVQFRGPVGPYVLSLQSALSVSYHLALGLQGIQTPVSSSTKAHQAQNNQNYEYDREALLG